MSSTFAPAETLRAKRPLLLAMEAIGWFHMAGKARAEFLREHGGDKVGYSYERWHQQETPPFPWDELLEWVKRLYSDKNLKDAWPDSFAKFTEKHGGRGANDPGLLGLLQAGHGIVSGVEKNLPTSTSKYLNQTLLHMWLSSPWGYPKRNLLADPPGILTPQGWKQLVAEMRRVLEELRDLGIQGVRDVALWHRWREQAIGEGSFIRRAFLSTLAETRLPNNDVTLWDQSYVAAALFKSAVAGAILDSGFPWTGGGIKSKARWRLLTVAIGTEHYEARSVKIGDWTGAQASIEEFFCRVAELVEVDLAVGALLYRDSSVAVFSFPGERFDEEEQERHRRNDPDFRYDEDNFAPWLQDWKGWLQGEVERIAEELDLETPPAVRLSAPTRSLVPIVRERREAQKVVAIPVHKPWDVRWTTPSEARGHVCPVCRVRLNGDPTSKTKPCRVCRDRRHHRRNDWLTGRFGYDTIWFEEVADRNGRLALLTFSLDIEPWLKGEQVDSLRAQAIPEWVKFNPVLSGQPNPIAATDLMDKLTDELKQRFRDSQNPELFKFNENDKLLANLQEGYPHYPKMNPKYSNESAQDYNKRLWRLFFEAIVEDRTSKEKPDWNKLSDDERAAWLAHQLFRKLPSPGRIYRFWREAEGFFRDLLREFRQIASRSDNPWRVRRLVLVPKDKNGWQDLTLYDGRWRGRQISLVYVQSLGGFVTASNLARLLRPEEKCVAFRGVSILLEEDDRFGQTKDLQVESVRELRGPHSHLGVYAPVIPVEISPLRFRVLVPLEAAFECMDLAASWWKERFARVWDRLSLRAGMIAFPRTLPYQAVVEATRNLEEVLEGEEEIWQVEEVEHRAGVMALRLKRKDGRCTLRVVPIALPDGRDDVFYPYVVVEDRQLRFPRDFRHPQDGRIYRHVADLRPGDGIKVVPSRVVTLSMESTAARFADLDVRYLEEWGQMREIWRLLTRVAPSQTALQRLRSDLANLERDWKAFPGSKAAPHDLFKDTVRGLLVRHLSVQGSALETLTEAAMNDLLRWALDWHMSALRESLS